jgi:uncharacterized protein (DUF1501 family)
MKHTFGLAARRQFLRQSAAMTALAGSPFAANMLAMGAASAQQATDYKALVCVYLNGGNDQSNTLVPTSASEYEAYRSARPTLALPKEQLLSLSPTDWTGPDLALNGVMPALKSLFDQGKVAALANVGTLAAPTTQSDFFSGRTRAPFQLFSHADQMSAWQTGLPDRPSSTGWLGRIGDLTASAYNAGSGVSIAMSVAGNNMLQAGNGTIQYQLTTLGAVKVGALDNMNGSTAAGAALRKLTTQAQPGTLFENELSKVSSRAIAAEMLVRNSLAATSVATAFPATDIGKQLQMVARMVAARGPLSQKRQLFFVQLNGFDMHDDLVTGQATKLKELSDAMAAFYQATVALGVARNVVTFTASEFGRTLQSNGRGADHGWGAHHFIMGDAVAGNRIYGNFPTVALKGPDDAGQGRLIPTTSVDEYGATLASWFGVSDTNMKTVLPNIDRFAHRNLGFLSKA